MATQVCPTCRRPFDPDRSEAIPFCSQRCRQIDLARWLDEAYGVPCEADDRRNPPDEEPS